MLTGKPGKCDRCGSSSVAFTGSWFSTQMICEACSFTESKHSQFDHAKDVEREAVASGDLNFPGIGEPQGLAYYHLKGSLGWLRGEQLIDSITCLVCGMESFSQSDIQRRWCGKCHAWHAVRVDPKPRG